jgi:uncharacterized protein involved in exopolysaccharide biosynthesis
MTTQPQHGGEPEAHSTDVDWYVRAIRRRWLTIGLGAAVGGALAFGYASSRPLAYQGVTTLLVVPPSQPSPAAMNPATFRALVENLTLASEVISELKLDGALTPHSFLERALSVEEVRGTNIVRVKVTLNDPNLAAEASRRLASKAIVLNQKISQDDGATIQGQLKNHLTEAQKRRTSAENDLLAYKQSAQVDLLKEDATAQLKKRGDLLRLVVEIETEKARLAAALAEIKRQQPLLTAGRLPGAEEALRRADARSEADAQNLDLSNPYVNPVYQTLDFQIATSRTRIAALEKERDELIDVKKIGGKELSMLTELYRREIEQARLKANFDLADRTYSELALRYEQSRTQPLGSGAQLQVIDEALPPERPIARRRVQYATFGAGTGLVLTLMLALAFEIRSRQE